MLDGVDRNRGFGGLFVEAVTYRILDLSVITDRSPIGENTENINSVRSRMAAPEK
ncbi:MAG: hypothetical protein JGK28_24995 [Microcoleus sp. PH2017_07_MST_O_A]|nr:hypothetical protein [Microcoleus sp. PH2017_07_MST_O_A]